MATHQGHCSAVSMKSMLLYVVVLEIDFIPEFYHRSRIFSFRRFKTQ